MSSVARRDATVEESSPPRLLTDVAGASRLEYLFVGLGIAIVAGLGIWFFGWVI